MKEPNFLQKKAIESPRIAGAIMTLVGLYFTYLWLYQPYSKIIANEPEVKFSFIGIISGILFPVIGIIFMLTGKRYAEFIFTDPKEMPSEEKIKFYGVVLLVVGICFYFFVNWLAKHGYKL
jgi:hypothetical protein